MRNIAYKPSYRGTFIISMLLVLTTLVLRPVLPVRTARAESDGRTATLDGRSGEASPPSFYARTSGSSNGDSAERLLVRGVPQVTVPLPPIVGGGGGAKIDAKYLEKNGPLLAAKFIMDDFDVTGFVQGGEPVVIVYELEAGSTAKIIIQHVKDPKKSFTISLQPTNGEIKEVESTLPDWFGDKPKAGVFIVKAMKNGSNPKADAGFNIEGIGEGHGAVGSLVIDQTHFQPSPIHPKLGEKTRYSFRSLRHFNSAAVDFRAVVRNSDGLPDYQSVSSKRFKNGLAQDQVVEGEWDGMNSRGGVSRGMHRFMVRAWRGLKGNGGGDWTFVFPRERVVVE
jgi:hypothetical protein